MERPKSGVAEPGMTLAVWSDRYETGIPEIDAQHRRLFQAINRMEAAYQAGTEEAEAQESLAFLARYTLEHFETEEAIWHEYLTDDSAEIEHKAIHRSFVEDLTEWPPLGCTQLAPRPRDGSSKRPAPQALAACGIRPPLGVVLGPDRW